MVFVFGSVYVMDYIYRFIDVEPVLHPWDEADLIMMDKLFDVLLDVVCQYFVEDFYINVIMDIGLKFSFSVASLPGFGIRMMWSHKMSWGGFHLFLLFGIVSEGMVSAPLCTSGRIRL